MAGTDTGSEPDFGRSEKEEQYIDKELAWKKSKAGFFSASTLERLMSKSDTWTAENISYLYEIQYERRNKILLSAPNNRNFRLGRENEPTAVEWLRMHYVTQGSIRHYDVDFDDKIFIKTDMGFGVSPDADEFVNGEIVSLFEIKSAVGSEERSVIFSPTFPYDKKRLRVWMEHKWQIIGQFIGVPQVNIINLFKYDSVDEENDTDERNPMDVRRGIIFPFRRDEMGSAITSTTERLAFANKFLNDGEDPSRINEFWKKRKKQFI